jgi:hypothetical protein
MPWWAPATPAIANKRRRSWNRRSPVPRAFLSQQLLELASLDDAQRSASSSVDLNGWLYGA